MLRIVLFLFLSSLTPAYAAPVFDFNANCLKAYRQLMALQNEEAGVTLKAEQEQNPDNIIPAYLADYRDCLALLFNGSATGYKTFNAQQDTRLDILESAGTKSPWYRFCKANIYLHGALVHLRFGDQFKAVSRFRKSYLLLKENKELYPDFQENKILLGLEQALAGAIPDNYKWIGAVFGIKGNITKGVSEIVSYLNAHPDGNAPMHEEAMIYYAYLKFYLLREPEAAWKYLNSSQYNEANNLMRSFIKANIALNYRKADDANAILTRSTLLKEYKQYPIMAYERAEAMLFRLDFNCTAYYREFITTSKGNHFIKDAWMKMAWTAYLQNNQQQADYCVSQIKKQGNTATDADKQALRFAEFPIWPPPTLLEVRLLIDGGFYKNALSKIRTIDKKQLGNAADMLDYHFRYGRIFEELKDEPNALLFYTATINSGRKAKEYYAARAALQKGFIYERQGNKAAAIEQFRDCLSMRNHDSQSSIDQLAKAGLNRLGQ